MHEISNVISWRSSHMKNAAFIFCLKVHAYYFPIMEQIRLYTTNCTVSGVLALSMIKSPHFDVENAASILGFWKHVNILGVTNFWYQHFLFLLYSHLHFLCSLLHEDMMETPNQLDDAVSACFKVMGVGKCYFLFLYCLVFLLWHFSYGRTCSVQSIALYWQDILWDVWRFWTILVTVKKAINEL